MCGVAQHSDDTQGWSRHGTNPSKRCSSNMNRWCMCQMTTTGILRGRPDMNNTTSIIWGHWLGWRTGSKMCQLTTLGTEGAGIYQSFPGLLNYSKNFYLTGIAQMSNKFPKKLQSISNKFQNYFEKKISPLLKNFNPSYVEMSPIKSKNE